jgi:DNA-binding HxlR family transcriptional regulator
MATKRKGRDFNPTNCGVTHFLNRVGGKWKVLIIYGISRGVNRFSMLRKAIPSVSKQMLVNQLRELEEDNIIGRTVFPEVPPKVEYKLSRYGKSIMPVIYTIQDWGLKDLKITNSKKTSFAR